MSTSATPPAPAELRTQLADVMLRDQRRLRRRLDGIAKIKDAERRSAALGEIATAVASARDRVAQRRAAIPAITYPEQLPVSARKDDIAAAIRDHQVVIVAGETGSGKTTQLPKICLEQGRGVLGSIGHTQPRRIAARTVAERVAEELDRPLGSTVGWKVRFTDNVGADTLVKVMTDGILLAEIQHDRMLRQYDTLIIDEAHERSLNIDFILGYLKQLLPRRPDLKVIITSATIDPERFAEHFGGAPIVEVSGRTYPVEVRYRPVIDPADPDADPDRDQLRAINDAVDELCAHGPGDILVFLSGEREIRDATESLRSRQLRGVDVLPLYGRLSAAEQHRVFQPHTGRHIVLATNVAETSLTVPGIKYVIDPGTARISRYSYRTKVQRLPIEPISQASANQRKGRCGRVSDGVCIRLYAEDDFLARPEFTDPEILRTNLASVILQMIAANLGEIGSFPFLDAPDKRNITAGMQLLHELHALTTENATGQQQPRLTETGRKLAQLPVDPRLGRMVLEAANHGCVREVMVIAAALSIQDPRERPAEAKQAADQQHARFTDKGSDFLSYLNLWEYLTEQQKQLSGNQFRKLCRAEYLNYLRVREWQDVFGQLRQLARGLDLTVPPGPRETAIDPRHVHTAILAGLLSHVGVKDGEKKEYLGARGTRFAIFPGSALFKNQPRWVVAAELVETSRLWARTNAAVEPDQLERLAEHLVKRSYSEPHWERNRGAVVAYEKVTLYGVPIVPRRKVNYAPVDPELCRELFIRHALVDGDWRSSHQFLRANRALLDEVADLEQRARRRDILVDDETLFAFYDERIPAEVVSARHFDSWWKKAKRDKPELLTFDPAMLRNDGAAGVDGAEYPDQWSSGELALPLAYEFEPGSATDGVTVDIPLAALNQVSAADFSWQVPGLREELVVALIKSLPKQLRRQFVPAPDFAKAAIARMSGSDASLLDELARALGRLTGVTIPPESWQLDRVPDHLRLTYRILDEQGRTVDQGKDLAVVKERMRPKMRAAIAATAGDIERTGLVAWEIGELPRTHEQRADGYPVTAFPALVDEGTSVAVRLQETPEQQETEHWRGTRRLLRLVLPSPNKAIQRGLDNAAKLTLAHNPHGGVGALLEDCIDCAVDALLADAGGPVWDEPSFTRLRDRAAPRLNATVLAVLGDVRDALAAAREVEAALADARFAPPPAVADIRRQLAGLIYPGFVTGVGFGQLPELPRYLRAMERRLAKLAQQPDRDAELMRSIAELSGEYEELAKRGDTAPAVREVRWMIEELRVSFFAQELKTAYPISVKRVRRALAELG
ncbi:ATP-dependent helicase HrpA [Tamaricihabitans halophyticus]|uniref:RNA helicase n=1 Tax=Tamaricihabitans halophyticus TaxID=1262583 RepID=A0A4R2QMK4_9PSEU|nr:ATP-dependent RNA helicase HrpA [Tamaricihabitans halophyticus]TCP50119.1 ATP-dependent helicase HrpA [Tamaricihabitans halophyticus]